MQNKIKDTKFIFFIIVNLIFCSAIVLAKDNNNRRNNCSNNFNKLIKEEAINIKIAKRGQPFYPVTKELALKLHNYLSSYYPVPKGYQEQQHININKYYKYILKFEGYKSILISGITEKAFCFEGEDKCYLSGFLPHLELSSLVLKKIGNKKMYTDMDGGYYKFIANKSPKPTYSVQLDIDNDSKKEKVSIASSGVCDFSSNAYLKINNSKIPLGNTCFPKASNSIKLNIINLRNGIRAIALFAANSSTAPSMDIYTIRVLGKSKYGFMPINITSNPVIKYKCNKNHIYINILESNTSSEFDINNKIIKKLRKEYPKMKQVTDAQLIQKKLLEGYIFNINDEGNIMDYDGDGDAELCTYGYVYNTWSQASKDLGFLTTATFYKLTDNGWMPWKGYFCGNDDLKSCIMRFTIMNGRFSKSDIKKFLQLNKAGYIQKINPNYNDVENKLKQMKKDKLLILKNGNYYWNVK